MAKLETFSFRLDEVERQLLAELSKRLQRNQSDAIRLLIREAARSMETAEMGVNRDSNQ